jgi:lipoyl(octanoyl) transferase
LNRSAEEVRTIDWAFLGTVPYRQGLSLQERLRADLIHGGGRETLLLLEHEPVITLGRNAKATNVVASREELVKAAVAVVPTSRGGDVTCHGPGQLVGYPVFRLRHGIRAHVSSLATGIIAVLAGMNITAEWRAERPGLWVGRDKICAMGFHVHRGVATHGFALNASIDLTAFCRITPCGLADAGVTSIAKLLGSAPAPESLAALLVRAFERTFAARMIAIADASSRLQNGSRDR